ncbi:MAG: CD1845 family protein [Mobilitalea sp.]
MRILLKIILFPVHIALSLVLLPCKFVCLFGTMILSILSFLIFTVALLTIVLLGESQEGIRILILAFLISPFGLPMAATWLIGVVDGVSERIRTI